MQGWETVVRRRPKRPGRFGDDSGTPDDKTITGCFMIPRTSRELTDREDTVVAGMTLAAPPGADIQSTDRIIHLGLTYDIDGEVGRYRKNGREVQVMAALKRVTG